MLAVHKPLMQQLRLARKRSTTSATECPEEAGTHMLNEERLLAALVAARGWEVVLCWM